MRASAMLGGHVVRVCCLGMQKSSVKLGTIRIQLRRLILAFLAFAVLMVGPARAQLTIEIVGGAGTTIPIAIVPFENEATFPLGISGIVAADLRRSGLFRQVDDAGIVPRPARAEEVNFGEFRSRGADAVVVGSMRPLADGRVEVRFALLDAVKATQL